MSAQSLIGAARTFIREARSVDALALAAALCAAPVSIAAAEILLALALVTHLAVSIRSRSLPKPPRVFYFWLIWAALEIVSWLCSAHPAAGKGEIRHLFLICALFVLLPTLARPGYRLAVWRGVLVTATASSLALIVGFAVRILRYRHELSAGGDPSLYLRSGGFLHHWMIYAVVEMLVMAGLLEFHAAYPEERRWVRPAIAINAVAVFFSLTRGLWLGCLVLLVIHLAVRSPRLLWAVPALPALAFLLAPGPVRYRIHESLQSDYYSNAERLQMWRVGWQMIRERPIFGVGPGLVEPLYTRYLAPAEPVPAYHGHLHNDAVQLAAQFGLPVLCAAILFLAVLLRDLLRTLRSAPDRETRFLCSAGLMGLVAFLLAGLTDYAYGHSVGLILFSFVSLSPLVPAPTIPIRSRASR
ncbi:MAG TPA: O-antigen ligase family protein [Bryobacteraceae bacterium]|jgi:O-antigen ligase